ncbi:hypothetical protein BGX26_000824 [Mortierella sp. AD094]|nr:hypothetical protein BGX26_000824 [Mortierella sp. AD094]
MTKVFSNSCLKKIRGSLKNDIEKIDIDDGYIQRDIRCKTGDKESQALDELQGLSERRLRMFFEQLTVNIPRKVQEEHSELTMTVNHVAPILRTFLDYPDDDINTHL